MPELPEVETVRRGLLSAFEGAVLKDVLVHRRDLRIPIPLDFELNVIGKQIIALKRRSKYVLIELEDASHIIIHLGMSGRMRIESGNPPERDKHDHVEFITDSRFWVRFGDPRRFGFIDLIAAGELENYPSLKKLGPEPLDDQFDGNVLYQASRNKKTNLKTFLMDQRIIAGLGNIYVNEALFRAKLSPTKKAASLTKAKAQDLAKEIKKVLEEAIIAGGSSLKDHRQTDGELGYFQHSFKVYGREDETCSSCQKHVIKRIVQQGRSTFYCSNCQQ